MPGAWLLADDITSLLDERIITLGPDAFAHGGNAHLYTGPSRVVSEKILDFKYTNHEYAKILAKKHGATLIDDTAIGKFLEEFEGIGVYDYIDINPYIARPDKFREADKVWRHASRKFIESLWGKVSTSVCGPDRSRIFYTEEIPVMAEGIPALIHALMKKDDIEVVNDIPMVDIRRHYKSTDWEAACRLICLGEQRALMNEARHSGLGEIMDIYLNCQERYRIDRGEMAGTAANRPIYNLDPNERLLLKQRKLQEFVAANVAIFDPDPDPPAVSPPMAASGMHPRLIAGLH